MRRAKRSAVLLLVVSFVAAGCGGSSGGDSTTPPPAPPPPPPPPDFSYLDPPGEQRAWLKIDALDADNFPEQSPFHNGHFMPVGDAGAALHAFSGTLSLDDRALGFDGEVDFFGQRRDLFPQVALRFVSDNGFLIPLDRGPQFSDGDESAWGLILSPGRVWSEPGDGNRSRASFPFALVHSNFTQAHNGIATFVYDAATVSHLRVQVVQETASWEIADYWGHLPMSYVAEGFAEAADVIAAFADARADRIAHEPWSALEDLHGGPLDEVDGFMAPEEISASAVLWDDTLYVSRCGTRYGEFPYCRYMRNAVFSVTKSAVGALALLRLAQKFGAGILDERIEDHVPVTADHGGWAGVTFRDALGMASGVGEHAPDPDSNQTHGDEGEPKFAAFQRANSVADKLDVVFSYDNYPWGPGERVRYNSINTFALAAAMDAYLKANEGPDASLWAMLTDEVFAPIGIRHAPMLRTVEAGGAFGLPVLYSGYYPTLDEIARIARLLQSEGVHDGTPLLHPELTATALYRRAETGLEAPFFVNDVEHSRYQMSFWSFAVEEDSGCIARVPMMVGFGGNLVAVLPNGASAFRFTDTHLYRPRTLVDTARVLGPLCT